MCPTLNWLLRGYIVMDMRSEHLPENLLADIAGRFRVLGDTTRLTILRTLLVHGEMSVGDLAQELGAGQANVSKHLRILADANIVSRRQQGTAVFVSVDDPTLTVLCDVVCDRLQELAEARARAFAAG